MNTQKTILIITDGIGHKEKSLCNAFKDANTPTYEKLFKELPHSLISTYGLSVGLPNGQMGNSEVGHMTIGSGRVLYQDLVKISLAIKDKTIKENLVFKTISNRVHLISLLSDGGVHSHIDHLKGFIEELKGKEIFLHLITDGRDVSPNSAKKYIEEMETRCNEKVKIASIGGRFYTMDRDNRWERVEKGYRAIVEAIPQTNLTPKEYIDSSYKKEVFDEFIEPIAFNNYNGIEKNDSVVILNFRSDRVRQISKALGDKEFKEFEKKHIPIDLITMTEYDSSFDYPILFKKEKPKNTLAQVISNAGLTQFHTAETEKYAHVTFFLNGGQEEPFIGESRLLIPSPDVKTYDLKPEMSAKEVCDGVLEAIEQKYDFIVVNFANGDMVGHTGNFEAGKKAVEVIDSQIGRIFDKAKEYSIVLTSDHGNCEEMKDEKGNTLTNHTVGDVWCFVKDKNIKELKSGGLNNIAPTVLKIMGLDIAKEMDNPLF